MATIDSIAKASAKDTSTNEIRIELIHVIVLSFEFEQPRGADILPKILYG